MGLSVAGLMRSKKERGVIPTRVPWYKSHICSLTLPYLIGELSFRTLIGIRLVEQLRDEPEL